jgi:ribosomal protein S18 acetylase RimI-like enzyme
MDISIRLTTEQDADAVGRLWFQLSLLHEPYANYYAVKRGSENSLILYVRDLMKRNCIIFVAEVNKKIVGFVSGYIVFRNPQLTVDRVGKVDNIIVDQSYRGGGIGTKLLERLFQYFDDNKVKYFEISCDLDNADALRLYKRLGFKEQKLMLVKENE